MDNRFGTTDRFEPTGRIEAGRRSERQTVNGGRMIDQGHSSAPGACTRRAGAVAPGTPRARGDQGATLIEAAIIMPVLFLVLFGIIESATMFRDYLGISNAATSAARTAAIYGNDMYTDYWTLVNFKRDFGAIPMSSLQRVVVFKTDAAGAAAGTPYCTTGGSISAGSHPCNVYTQSDVNMVPITPFSNVILYFGNCPTTVRDCFWRPTNRKVAVAGANGPPDYVGIYVSINHKYLTNLFGTTKVMNQTVITKIEPKELN